MRNSITILILALAISTLAHAGNFTFFGTYWETKQGKSYEAVGLGIPESDWQTAFDTHADEGRELVKLDVYDQGGKVFRQVMAEFRIVGYLDGADTGDLGSCFRDCAAVFACDQQIDVAADFGCRGDRVQRGRTDFIVVVFYDYQVTHD